MAVRRNVAKNPKFRKISLKIAERECFKALLPAKLVLCHKEHDETFSVAKTVSRSWSLIVHRAQQ